MEPLSTFGALMCLRRGSALSAEAVQAMTATLEHPLSVPALHVQAPHWLTSSLNNPASKREQKLVLLEARHQCDPCSVIMMQTDSAQLRPLLHLNDRLVQDLLRHALSCGLLRTLVCTETAPLATGLTTPVGGEAASRLARLLDSVQDVASDLNRASRLGERLVWTGRQLAGFGPL